LWNFNLNTSKQDKEKAKANTAAVQVKQSKGLTFRVKQDDINTEGQCCFKTHRWFAYQEWRRKANL
jgi:hypothetical protein